MSYWPLVAVSAIAGYFLWDFFRAFNNAVGSFWRKSLDAAKGSATILWARFSVVVTAVVSLLAQVADLLHAPAVATAIQTYLSPKIVGILFVAAAIITELARRRSL